MPVTSIYDVFFNGEKWVARLGDELLDRASLLAKIKLKFKVDLPADEEWAAYALIEQGTAEARWRAGGNLKQSQ